MLQQGIGDTIRVSLTPEPGGDRTREVIVAQEILQTMGLRSFTPLVTACPGCGRTTSTFFMSGGDEGKSGFPVHWPKGMQGSAITDGGWGPGFEDPFYSQHFFKMNKEPDADKRMAMTEEYFDHVFEQSLCSRGADQATGFCV